MITKENFEKFIDCWNTYDNAIDRISKAVTGYSYYGTDIYDTDWNNAVGMMLDIFINSHFTEEGADIINYYLFEDIEDKVIYITQEGDLFNKSSEIKYPLKTPDDLWNFLLTDKKTYFLDA